MWESQKVGGGIAFLISFPGLVVPLDSQPMKRGLLIVLVALALVPTAFLILWAASLDFGMRQSVEFFPYDDTIPLDDGTTIRSSGVVVVVNKRDAFPNDRAMAALMMTVKQLYSSECSGDNWEIAIRRPLPDRGEEKYSFYTSAYEVGGPGTWIEYGRWTDGVYTVIDSYSTQWEEVDKIAQGRQDGFRVEVARNE